MLQEVYFLPLFQIPERLKGPPPIRCVFPPAVHAVYDVRPLAALKNQVPSLSMHATVRYYPFLGPLLLLLLMICSWVCPAICTYLG